jgi:hypothetical protein
MAEFNSSVDAAHQVAAISQERWDDEGLERPNPFFIAVRLLSLLALALVIAGGAIVTAVLQTTLLFRGGSDVSR